MTKEEKIKGEEILKKWASTKQRLVELQKDINLIKNGITPMFINDINDNKELVSTYNEVLSELLLQMKNKIINYKNVEDILDSLEKFEKNIIIFRYQKKYSWEKIAMENHISRTNCFNIKNRIIQRLLKAN